MAENFPNLKKKISSTGITESSKQDDPKETHTKIYHN